MMIDRSHTEDEIIFNREKVIFNVTEDLLLLMENRGVTKADLAKLLNKSKAHVSQVLSGGRNMTLGTLADIVLVLNSELSVRVADESITHLPIQEFEHPWKKVHWQKPKPAANSVAQVIDLQQIHAANETEPGNMSIRRCAG
jgi:transcriptional regulator with XRE-family HTH domain